MTLTDNLFLSRYRTDARAFLRGGKLKLVAESALRFAAKRIVERMDVRKAWKIHPLQRFPAAICRSSSLVASLIEPRPS